MASHQDADASLAADASTRGDDETSEPVLVFVARPCCSRGRQGDPSLPGQPNEGRSAPIAIETLGWGSAEGWNRSQPTMCLTDHYRGPGISGYQLRSRTSIPVSRNAAATTRTS